MIRKALTIALAASFGMALFAQSTPAVPKIPDSVLFQFFFLHLSRVERAADALKAQGKRDQPMRNLLKNQTQLTDLEFAFVLSAAMSCTDAYATQSKANRAVVQQLKQQYPVKPQQIPNAATVPAPALQQLMELEARRKKIITDCISNIQAQMGPNRFQILCNYVLGAEVAKFRRAPASTASN